MLQSRHYVGHAARHGRDRDVPRGLKCTHCHLHQRVSVQGFLQRLSTEAFPVLLQNHHTNQMESKQVVDILKLQLNTRVKKKNKNNKLREKKAKPNKQTDNPKPNQTKKSSRCFIADMHAQAW